MGMEGGEGKKVHSSTNLSAAPINHPRINGLLGINENVKSSNKKDDQCHRFSLKLFLPDDKDFPEFDYITLLKEMGVDSASSDNTAFGGLHFSNDADDLKALAQKFEEKYAPKKKESYKKHKNEFVDVGYGYDESDTFIDNTEAYDEVVPSDWTTEHGGFYINQGNLDFRPCEKYSGDATKKEQAAYKKKKKKQILDGKAVQKTPKELSTQKKKKHLLHKEKQRKRQESLQKATKILAKKKKTPVFIDESSQDIPLALLNKSVDKEKDKERDKMSSSHVSVDTSFEDNIPLAKIAKSPALVGNTSVNNTHKSNNSVIKSTLLQKPNGSVALTSDQNVSSPLNSVLIKSADEKSPSQILASSVVNKDSSTDEEVKSAKVETPLPDGLSEELIADIMKLKDLAKIYIKGKGFFTVEVNKVMLSFARSCRQLSPKIRNSVYDHMLCFLPCARDTLVKRCRRLIVQHQREMEDEPIRLLKEAIDDSMLEQKKEYDEDVAEALQEQAREQIKQTGMDPMKSETPVKSEDNETNEEDEKKSVDDAKKYFPKKKYSWTEGIRKLLCDVVKVRVGLFKMSKSKSLTAEEYIKDFLESEIRKLWPKGWMTSRVLYKESRTAHQEITQPGKGKNRFTKLPCGYPIANLTVGESTSSTPPYILKSGPKTPISSAASAKTPTSSTVSTNSPLNTPVSTKNGINTTISTVKTIVGMPVNTLKSHNSGVITSPVTLSNQIVCNGMTGSVSKQSQPCTIKTVVPKSVIKTVSSVTNAKIVAATMNNANLLTISKTTSSFGNIIVSNPSSYSLPKSSTVVTWNKTSSLISTPSTSPGKNFVTSSNKLPANLKISSSAKGKTPAQINARFVETIEKTTFLKTEPVDEATPVKQCALKVDTLLRNVEASENTFYSNTSSSCPSTSSNFNRSNIQPRTTVVSHYAISPTFIHPPKTLHNDTMNSEIYYRQVKRKLPVEVNDNRNTPKRNISDSILNHSSKTISMENKTWSEVENDLVRLSQEERSRKIKEESPSPPPAIMSRKSPDNVMKGNEWCFSPTSQIVHISQTKNISNPGRSSVDNIVKTIVSRSQNITRPIEPPKFDTNTLCRKSLSVVPNQNKYVLSSKQLSPQLYQQSAALPAYTSRKSSQLSINNSCSKNNPNLHDYPSPQHPGSRIQISKSDHQYSTTFENNGRPINDPHSSLQSPHNNNENPSKLRHSSHITPPQKQQKQQQQQQQQQQQSVHGIHMQGKFIGLQSINQSMTSHQSHSRLSLEEQLKAHHKDGRNIRSEQEYQSKFGTYAPRFS